MTRPATWLRKVSLFLLCAAVHGLVAAGQVGDTPQFAEMPGPMPAAAPVPARAALGRLVFFDTRMSEPQGTSCASCHDPEHAFGGNHGSRVGVAFGSKTSLVGTRNTPTLLYVRYVPQLFFYQDDDAPAPVPFGGLFADGRVDSLAELVTHPMLNPLEMHNANKEMIARKLRTAPYANGFRKEFGDRVFANTRSAIAALGAAMNAYLQSEELAPFSSRYDAWVQGKGKLTAQEMRGLKLFKDPDRGNCIACHKFNDTSSNPARSLFTDFGYDAIGVPRNRAIPANNDVRHFDEGLCTTAKQKHWPDTAQWCGYFRTPTLRNVAVRERYMHNGVFSSLREVVAFYATRSIEPEKWYRHGAPFDDVAPNHKANINIATMPYNRRKGMKPALDDNDINDIVAFLCTLTDARYEQFVHRITRGRKLVSAGWACMNS